MYDKEKEALKRLEEKIGRASQARSDGRDRKQDRRTGSGLDLGMRIVAELAGGTVVGAGIGLFLDSVFGTKPICLIVFLVIGGFAGFLNVYRTAMSYEARQDAHNKEVKKE